MKLSITFETIQEGLAAISLLTGAGVAVTTETEDTTPATPGTPDPVLGVELDSKGFPWCAEVHAGTKGKNKDGSWKAKKGVDDATRAAVEQATLARLQATAAQPPAVVAAAPVAAPVAAAPVAPVAPVAPAMPMGIAAAAVAPVSYEKLVEKYSTMAAAGLIDATKVGAIYAACGVTDPNALATDETMCGKVYAEMVKLEQPAIPAMPGMPGM